VKTRAEAVLLDLSDDEAEAFEEASGMLTGVDPHLSEAG
jgi:hypothetical protein